MLSNTKCISFEINRYFLNWNISLLIVTIKEGKISVYKMIKGYLNLSEKSDNYQMCQDRVLNMKLKMIYLTLFH